MADYDAEVSIQNVDRRNEPIFREGWMYVTDLKDKKCPRCFAPYFTLQVEIPGVSMISQVMHNRVVVVADMPDIEVEAPTEEHFKRWTKGLELLREVAKVRGFAHKEVRLRYLDSPQELCSPPITKREHRAWVDALPRVPKPKKIGAVGVIGKGFSVPAHELRLYLEDSETLSKPAEVDLQAMCANCP